jgi:hypothetical protein
MPRVGFVPTIQVFQRAKAVHASDRAATMMGGNNSTFCHVLSTHLAGILLKSSILWNCIPPKSANVSEEQVTSKFGIEETSLPATCYMLVSCFA